MTKRRVPKPTVMVGKTASTMKSYLTRDRTERKGYSLWFCRGPGKCPKGPVAQKLSKQRCVDCVKSFEGETIDQLMKRMEQGDA